jgi:nucleotide-binding universal stress UspA family protein
MKKLIAFVDGSSYSKSVCDHAAWLAVKVSASVTLIHVLGRRNESEAPIDLSGSIGLGARTALLDDLAELDGQMAKLTHQRGRAILDDAKDILHTAGVSEISTMLRNQGIVEAVQDFEGDADLIVIGKRGEGSEVDKMHLGSNFERVVRSSHRPILVASAAFKPIQRLLLAFDGGTSAMKAINYLAASTEFIGLNCHLLCVAEPSAEEQRQLDEAATLLRTAGHNVKSSIRPGQAEAVICEEIRANNVDLLLMGAYGHSRIRNLIIGSTTTEMIRSCKIPVMLFR